MSVVTTAPGAAPPVFRWDRFTVAAAAGYCLLVAGLSVGYVLGELRTEFGISGVITALHGSTFGVGLLLMGLFGVRIVDRIGRRSLLVASFTCSTAGITLFCFGQSWHATLAGTALSGLAGAAFVLVMPGLISDHHGPNLGRALAAVNGVPALAGMVYGLVIGAVLSAGLSWRGPYLALTVALVAGVALVAFPVAVPDGARHGQFSLRHIARREIRLPLAHIVNAIIVEFSVGVWGVTYLHEVGGASSGAAPLLAMVFGVLMLTSRLAIHPIQRVLGEHTISASFIVIGTGAAAMAIGPSLAVRVIGIGLAGLAAGPLYPLTFERFHRSAGTFIDSVGLGAYAALANGLGVIIGPLTLGILADSIGLRWGLLFVPVLAGIGAVTQRGRTRVVAR